MKLNNIALLFSFVFSLLVASASSQCFTDRHNTSINGSWVSCEMNLNPNPDHGTSHWIRYDLTHLYTLDALQFWNLNAYEITNYGNNEIIIDFSKNDGKEWEEWTRFDMETNEGSAFYEGELIDDLEQIEANTILITIIPKNISNCVGFSEIRLYTSDFVSNVKGTEINKFDLSIMPNPANNLISIALESDGNYKAEFEIINSLGQSCIKTYENIAVGANWFPIDVSSLSDGNYILNITTEGSISSNKFIKLK